MRFLASIQSEYDEYGMIHLTLFKENLLQGQNRKQVSSWDICWSFVQGWCPPWSSKDIERSAVFKEQYYNCINLSISVTSNECEALKQSTWTCTDD